MNKSYFLIVLFLCGLSVGNGFAAAPSTWALLPGAGAAAAATAPVAGHLGRELINAARGGKEPEVERLIAAGADVNAATQEGWTALMAPAIGGHEKIVEILLQAGANVNAQDHTGATALMVAAHKGHENIVERLLQVDGIDVNAVEQLRYTALMLAAAAGHEKTVERLLYIGADKDLQNSYNQTAEDLARAKGHENLANMIRDYGSGRLTKSAGKTG